MLTYRENEVLSCFVQANDYLKLVDVAKMLNISTRTVTRCIKSINFALKDTSDKIQFEHGKGYRWTGSEHVSQEIQQNSDDVILTKRMLTLLVQHEGISIEELGALLNYSESTLVKKIPDIKEILLEYGLELSSTLHKGYTVLGSELSKRRLVKNNAFNFFNNQVTKISLVNFSAEEFKKLRNVIIQFLVQNQMILSDYDTSNLVVYLAISIARIRTNNIVENGFELSHLTKEHAKKVESLLREVSLLFGVSFYQEEFEYILTHANFMVYNFSHDTTVNKQVEKFVREAIKELTKNSMQDYYQQQDFLDALILHINILVQRNDNSLNTVKNPLLQEVKKSHPVEMHDAIKLGEMIEQEFNLKLNEDEISYLAIHLGASKRREKAKKTVTILCSYGIGTSQLIKSRLEDEFSELTVVGIYPIQYLEVAQVQRTDLLISTLPLPNYQGNSQLIVVENILGEAFFQKINQALLTNKDKNEDYLLALIEKAEFQRFDADSKGAALQKLLNLLADEGGIPLEVLESVEAREQVSSTDIGNLVAIPHTLSSGEFESKIAIGILNTPVLWGNERVQLVFIIIMNQKDAIEVSVFKKLYGYFKTMDKVNKLIESQTLTEFITEIQ